jgi:TetR/AcrR family transcriptional regulator, transcriptional repressor for nem operon
MRKNRDETIQTRQRIVVAASRSFREKGIDGVGVVDLMQSAGLTHGGFYKHFDSKSSLVAEACSVALKESLSELAQSTTQVNDHESMLALVSAYLSRAHSLHPERGCAIAALGSEAIRSNGRVKDTMADGVENLLELIRVQLNRQGVSDADSKAHGVLSSLVGGLLLSRAVPTAVQSKAFLNDTKQFILSRL